MPDPDIARYARHSRWTDPGPFRAHLDRLPADPARLPDIVSGLVLHPLFAPSRTNASEVLLRRASDILAAIVKRDGRPLDQPREPGKRVSGHCRNYALLACAILRQHRVPARLRVGFADYFTADFWEDHWVCEYHDGVAWRLLDAELATEARGRFGIVFDPADVPRDRLLGVGPAWRGVRRGDCDPARFGVSFLGLAGLWFVAASLLRDLAALAMEEMMPWDCWGPAREFRPGAPVPGDWLDLLDRLAEHLAAAPAGFSEVQAILAAHRWAAPTPTVLSFPEGRPVEVAVG